MSFSFGAPKPSGFGGFGATTSAPSNAPLFGGQQQQQAHSFQQQPVGTGGSLFGNGSAAGSTPSLFSTNTQQGVSGSLFGSSSQPAQQQQPQQQASVGLFGSSLGQPLQSQQPTSSLFGGSVNSQQSGQQPNFSFGGSGSSQPPSTSLFGQGQQSIGQNQPGPSSSLFGNSSLFGAPQNQQQSQSQVQNISQGPTGQVTSAPLFGQSQSAASASLFGAKSSGGGMFGSSTPSSPFGAQQQHQFGSQQLPSNQLRQSVVPKLGDSHPAPNPNEPPIETRLEIIKAAWDPTSPSCRFQTYFYNFPTPPNTVAQYTRPPPQGTDEKAWAKAVRENPDPDFLVPALAIGFPSIQKRIESQIKRTEQHQNLLAEIQSYLGNLASTHSLATSLRVLRAQQNAVALSSRLLSLIAKSSFLSPNRNSSIRKEEEELRIALEGILNRVGSLKNRSNELWASVGGLKARKLQANGSNGGDASAGTVVGKEEWAVADEEGLEQILKILNVQQTGLDHLSRTLSAAAADIDVMKEAFGLNLQSSVSSSLLAASSKR